MEIREGVAWLRLESGKANAMDPPLLEGLSRSIREAEQAGARAMVITGYGKYFSGGLALPAIIGLERPALRAFMEAFSRAMLAVFASPLPVVAAVNGHAIAGGCVLALQADWRLMANADLKIGLNEVALGIGLPSSVIEPLRLAVPPASLTPIALEGGLYGPAAAKTLGLVDEVVPAAELAARAQAKAATLGAIPRAAFAQAKSAIRRPALEAMERVGKEDLERWMDTWFSPEGQERLRAVLERLSGGR